MATESSVGILIVEVLVVLGLGYFMVIGMFSFAIYHTQASAMLAFIPLAILLPIVLVMKSSGGIYENGIKVSRPLFVRLMGKHVFFRYEDIKAFYPAEFVTSAQMMTPRTGWDHSTYHYIGQPHVAAFGEAYGEMLTDPGYRTGVGMATAEGEYILKQATPMANQSPYGQMMYYIKWAMGVRNLPLVKVPLQLSGLEFESLNADTRGMGFRWYAIVAALALGLPFIPLVIAYIYVMVTGNKSLELVLFILLAITVSTIIFVAAYQYQDSKRIRAKNRLSYFQASQQYMIPEGPV
jgi:hypothetical protein